VGILPRHRRVVIDAGVHGKKTSSYRTIIFFARRYTISALSPG